MVIRLCCAWNYVWRISICGSRRDNACRIAQTYRMNVGCNWMKNITQMILIFGRTDRNHEWGLISHYSPFRSFPAFQNYRHIDYRCFNFAIYHQSLAAVPVVKNNSDESFKVYVYKFGNIKGEINEWRLKTPNLDKLIIAKFSNHNIK